MQWSDLLCAERLSDPKYAEGRNRSIFVQDHDRIVFSAPFRRLANKTQVHPLYENDHIHHRLIHSVEVGSVGRSLAMHIGHWLIEQGEIGPHEDHSLANVVQAACAAHDIGNPPFGHSGEASIGDWFAERFDAGGGLCGALDSGLRDEFAAFEGNAQGFRIITRLEMYRSAGGMRLSKAVLGAFMKYPATAATRAALPAETRKTYAGLKKFGVFAAEEALFAEVAQGCGLPEEEIAGGRWWRRHPLVFVVEAADDICYNIVDLEDAYTSGDLPYDVVRDLLEDLAGRPNRDTAGLTRTEHIALLRSLAIGRAIDACVAAFCGNYPAIMAGSFSDSLIGASTCAGSFARIEDMAHERIFTSRRKTELEISGRQVIRNVLDGVLPVYEALAAAGWEAEALKAHPAQIARALSLDLRDIDGPEPALHALADFVSGMTDRYALSVSRMLSGT
ncbi:dGTP triphosphohydrolase [Salipiger sp. PrR002]|uniref:dGTP triphosphohydrolase n=1 Tax=Salipiger sp. PrR002 TaxID=2706489 RepID=UPI0013B8C36C|nr:dNTP triphosphohydrolase [Salipiger sp. PrR002]NDV99116.1 dNTP triphosphohydrolase [Salipiger sp. PrR002]NDW56069.1 dNTP triphosphohydrolase [Salipiger sp. PrR004]